MNIPGIKKAFPELLVPDVGGYYDTHIGKWRRTFEGRPDWGRVKKGGLYNKGNRRLSMLNTAKVLCDCFADLTFSEQVNITLDDSVYQDYVNRCLDSNGFWEQFPELIAKAYAFGGGVLKVYAAEGKPFIDFIHADRFCPVEWYGRRVTSGVFQSVTFKDGFYYTFFELHKGGRVDYKLFKSDTDRNIGFECSVNELYPDMEASVADFGVQMFSYFRPCVSNNAEYDVPLGMSVFANALDTLKSLDIVFDSFSREFVLGRKRIIVPSNSIQTAVDIQTGQMTRYFDVDDEAFVALSSDDNSNLKITDNTVGLRVDEHISAINALLNILCFQVGLPAGTLSFESARGIKTATEVVSQDSKTMRTVKSNKNLLTEALEGLVCGIIAAGVWLGDLPEHDFNVTIGWRDNIVVDDNTIIENNIKLVTAGLMSKLDAVMEIMKCDENTALKILERIDWEQKTVGLAL